ncbi:DUF3592 domain-containing protein [Actinomadura logoneensis]|nr:DUF3592 domain-containing protein [Actinomadura logoneensis]
MPAADRRPASESEFSWVRPLIGALVLFFIAAAFAYNHWWLPDRGARAQATVVRDRGSKGVDIEFTTSAGQRVKTSLSKGTDYRQSLRLGDSVTVRYDPEYPETAQAEKAGDIFGILGTFGCSVVGLICGLVAWKRWRQEEAI